MMKKVVISVIVIFFTIGAFAQTSNEKEAFITVYNEYEAKRKELGKTRIDLLNKYAEQWENMTNEQADAWMKDVMALSVKQDKLINTYYKKVKSVTNAKVATQFYQIEAYILTTIRYSILETIPFVEEKK